MMTRPTTWSKSHKKGIKRSEKKKTSSHNRQSSFPFWIFKDTSINSYNKIEIKKKTIKPVSSSSLFLLLPVPNQVYNLCTLSGVQLVGLRMRPQYVVLVRFELDVYFVFEYFSNFSIIFKSVKRFREIEISCNYNRKLVAWKWPLLRSRVPFFRFSKKCSFCEGASVLCEFWRSFRNCAPIVRCADEATIRLL